MESQIKLNTPANLISQTQWRYWIKIGTLNTKSGRLSFALYCTSNWWWSATEWQSRAVGTNCKSLSSEVFSPAHRWTTYLANLQLHVEENHMPTSQKQKEPTKPNSHFGSKPDMTAWRGADLLGICLPQATWQKESAPQITHQSRSSPTWPCTWIDITWELSKNLASQNWFNLPSMSPADKVVGGEIPDMRGNLEVLE